MDGGATQTNVYDALNHRVRTVVGSGVTEFVFNQNGQRVSTWKPGYYQLAGQTYWGAKPVEFYAASVANYQHQDWLGTERMRTTYTGAVEGSYQSLPYGDGQTSSGADYDAYHFAALDADYASGTDNAQFRQYSPAQGRWMRPDPYSGSYDLGNPQSFNRYSYVLNNPLSNLDPLGLDDCAASEDGADDGSGDDGSGCDAGDGNDGGGGSGGGGSDGDGTCMNCNGPSPAGPVGGMADSPCIPNADGTCTIYEDNPQPYDSYIPEEVIWSDDNSITLPTNVLWYPLASLKSAVKRLSHTSVLAPNHCLGTASRAMMRDYAIGEGVGTIFGGFAGGLVAAGFTEASDSYPFAGQEISSGIIGGGVMGAAYSLAPTTAGAMIDGAWTYLTCK